MRGFAVVTKGAKLEQTARKHGEPVVGRPKTKRSREVERRIHA